MSVQSFYENESWIGKWLLVVAVAALVITQNIAWREISGGGDNLSIGVVFSCNGFADHL